MARRSSPRGGVVNGPPLREEADDHPQPAGRRTPARRPSASGSDDPSGRDTDRGRADLGKGPLAGVRRAAKRVGRWLDFGTLAMILLIGVPIILYSAMGD